MKKTMKFSLIFVALFTFTVINVLQNDHVQSSNTVLSSLVKMASADVEDPPQGNCLTISYSYVVPIDDCFEIHVHSSQCATGGMDAFCINGQQSIVYDLCSGTEDYPSCGVHCFTVVDC